MNAGDTSGRKPRRRRGRKPMPPLKPKHRVPAPPVRGLHEDLLFHSLAGKALFSHERKMLDPATDKCSRPGCSRHAAVTRKRKRLCWTCYRGCKRDALVTSPPPQPDKEVITPTKKPRRRRGLGVQVFE